MLSIQKRFSAKAFLISLLKRSNKTNDKSKEAERIAKWGRNTYFQEML